MATQRKSQRAVIEVRSGIYYSFTFSQKLIILVGVAHVATLMLSRRAVAGRADECHALFFGGRVNDLLEVLI